MRNYYSLVELLIKHRSILERIPRKGIYMLPNSNKDMQIKGDKQQIDLTSSVEFLTPKFDELERERKEKDELINILQIEVSF